jgi:hypothetical protein
MLMGRHRHPHARVHKFRTPVRRGGKILYYGAEYLCILGTERLSCNHSGVHNFEVAPRFLQNCALLPHAILKYEPGGKRKPVRLLNKLLDCNTQTAMGHSP